MLKIYAAYSKCESERLASSSGGIFSLLAGSILSRNGSVYGVAMTDDCRAAEFVRVTKPDELVALRGSKYFQARVGRIYQVVKADLENEITVLFSGTACQINGLKGYLGREYSNLYCVDVICHGVPSPALWDKYVSYMEDKYAGKLEHVSFRCKDDNWTSFGMREEFDSTRVFISKDEDPFMRMFLRDYCLRSSCYNCVAKSIKMSDMTIADFWGIDNVAPEMNDEKGTSLVIVRSEKGEKLFSVIERGIVFKAVAYEGGVRQNPAEYQSPHKPEQRECFFVDMNSMPFHLLKDKYCKPFRVSLLRRAVRWSKRLLKNLRGVDTKKASVPSWENYGLLFCIRRR